MLRDGDRVVRVRDGFVAELERRLLRVPLRAEEGQALVLDRGYVLHALPARPRVHPARLTLLVRTLLVPWVRGAGCSDQNRLHLMAPFLRAHTCVPWLLALLMPWGERKVDVDNTACAMLRSALKSCKPHTRGWLLAAL